MSITVKKIKTMLKDEQGNTYDFDILGASYLKTTYSAPEEEDNDNEQEGD